MERHRTQEHIATLCAAGTIGIAATGFALASEDFGANKEDSRNSSRPVTVSTYSPATGTPNPAPYATPSTLSAPVAAQNVSQPPSRSTSLFRTKRFRDFRPGTSSESDTSGSRGSSLNRALGHRPRTADTRSTSERREPSAGSSWLKRISTISMTTDSSPAVSIVQREDTTDPVLSCQPASDQYLSSNKLVKRSTSSRALPDHQSRKAFLRRPATSHQRSVTMRELESRPTVDQGVNENEPTLREFASGNESTTTWRPYFEHGYPRKRHSVGALNEISHLRLIPNSPLRRPTLILGSSVSRSGTNDPYRSKPYESAAIGGSASTGRQKLRRSLSSIPRVTRRRYFTEPIHKDNDESQEHPKISPIGQSPISPLSTMSAFGVDLPSQSPVFGSSPPYVPNRSRFALRKRDSNIQSDPTTVSSDNDTRVFTDDDSLEFHSDTAFDSLATRASIYSQHTARNPKVGDIFLDDASIGEPPQGKSLTKLLSGRLVSSMDDDASTATSKSRLEHDGPIIKSHKSENVQVPTRDESSTLTPVRGNRGGNAVTPNMQLITDRLSTSNLEDLDDINWSPQSGVESVINQDATRASTNFQDELAPTSSPLTFLVPPDSANSSGSNKRMSIFDWSENQKAVDSTKSPEARPKTVHGKQPHETMRSRSSGRKAQSQMHFRSQSVPSSRDPQADPPHAAASKFGTWGLGHKPVSEEWSDDFEFDDTEETINTDTTGFSEASKPEIRGSMRGVKVPQSIIDRQASVHTQFGQVQEFMLLVEELKRLRAQALGLGILDSHSKLLWEDAESIINLATINDEDEEFGLIQPRASSITDIFVDESRSADPGTPVPKLNEQPRNQTSSRRSVSGPGSSSNGRPRGDSLAQAKNFLQTIHQHRGGVDSSPSGGDDQTLQKLPFDAPELKDLVSRSAAITRALKDIVRKAEGVSVSPTKHPQKPKDPAFSQIFKAIDMTPSPPYRKPFLPVR